MRMRLWPQPIALLTRMGVSFGVVAGRPQALMSDGSGAVAQAAPDADGEPAGEVADPVEPLALQAATTRATAHAATRDRGAGMSQA
jgi:hypothetical protein